MESRLRRRRILALLAAAALAGLSRPTLADEPPPLDGEAARTHLDPVWSDAFTLRSADGDQRLRIGGLVQGDGRFFAGPPASADAPVDQFMIRSARIELDGTIWRWFDVHVTPDFGQGRVQLQDAYTELRPYPWLRLRGGKFKVPFGLERLQYEGRTEFMERAFPTQIAPNRGVGAMLFGEVGGGALQFAGGVWNGVVDNSTLDLEAGADLEEGARLFAHPFKWTRRAALQDIGIGAAFTHTTLRGSAAHPDLPSLQTDGFATFFRYLEAPAGAPVDAVRANGARWRATAQGYYYLGRFGVLGEYVWNELQVSRTRSAGVVTQAWQGYVTFLLTPDQASFYGVRPSRPFDLREGRRGAGAWELGFRYSGITVAPVVFDAGFADPLRSARTAHSYTAGLNWYPTANTKFQLNYVHTDFQGDRAPEDAILGRLQFNL